MSDEPEKKVIDPKDAHEHGYWGWVPDETPNEAYTIAGVTETGETAKVSDTPKSTSKGASK